MPYTAGNLPDAVKALPEHARDIWREAFNIAFEQYDGDEAAAAKVAWAAVSKAYEKRGEQWVKRDADAEPHPHGPHECYCPECGATVMVDEGQPCNEQTCPECGARMRASTTGERRDNAEDDELATVDIPDVEILAVGKWHGSVTRTYKLETLQNLVKSFKALLADRELNYEPPLKLGHDDDQAIIQESGFPSIGWVQALRVKGDKLVADFKGVPKKLADVIKAGGYKKVSSELYFDYSIGGKTWPAVLKAVALLGADVPAVKTIADIRAAYDENAIPEVVVYMAEKQVLSLDGLMTELDRVIEEAEPAIKAKAGAPAIRTYLREVKAKLRALLAKAAVAENSDVSESLDAKARMVRDAWWAQLQGGLSGAINEGAGWIRDVFADSVVVEKTGGFEQVPYTVSEDGVVAFAMDKAVKVTIRYVPVEPTEESNAGTPANTNDEETQMREATAKVLGLPADATEDQVLKGIEALKSADKLSENEDLKAKLAAAEAQLQEKHVGEIVDKLVNDGRLLPAQVEAARAALRIDEKAFTALMEAQPKVVELGERGSGADSANPAGAELSESDRKVAEALGIKLEEFATARASEKGAK